MYKKAKVKKCENCGSVDTVCQVGRQWLCRKHQGVER